MLYTQKKPNAWGSTLIDLYGNVNTDLSFQFEKDAYAYGGCGLLFKGNFYIYGDSIGDRRQITVVVGCSLKRIGTLPFPFHEDACAAATNQFFLCHEWFSDKDACQTSTEPTGPFIPISTSFQNHRYIRSAANDGKSN